MTNEEAIRNLRWLRDSIDDNGRIDVESWYSGIDNDFRESLSIAIEVLERIGAICNENCGYNPLGEWIPVTYRPMTEEEEKEFCENLGIKEGSLEDWEKKVFTCHLPDDGEEILVSHGKYVCEDICEWDEYGCGLENNGDWCGITAWMPKPKPYMKEADNE